MQIYCPNCMTQLTIDATMGGKEVECTACQHRFIAPTVLPPAAPVQPPPAPPAPAPAAVAETPPAPEPAAPATPAPEPAAPTPVAESGSPALFPGLRKSRSLYLPKGLVEWLPLACLIVVFLLTFAKWYGCYPDGYSAYSQSAWQAWAGKFTTDPDSEKELMLKERLVPLCKTSGWLIPAMLLLLVSIAVAAATQVVPRLPGGVPVPVQSFWPYRGILLTATTALGLLLLLVQLLSGLSLENAADELAAQTEAEVKAEYAKENPKFTPDDPGEKDQQRIDLRVDQRVHAADFMHSRWVNLAVLFYTFALLSIGLQMWYRARGDRPEPRLGVVW